MAHISGDERFVPLSTYVELSPEEMADRARTFRETVVRRRTVRDFSDRPVPRSVIEECIRAAGSAPNGANHQPWHFVVVEDPDIKRKIRAAAEEEERAFYNGRAPDDWLEALEPIDTFDHKPD